MEDQNQTNEDENTTPAGGFGNDEDATSSEGRKKKEERVPCDVAQAAIDAILAIPLDTPKWDVAQVTKAAFNHRNECRDYRNAAENIED